MKPLKCPICKKEVEDSPENRYHPFCSERCKLIDLGRWLGGAYQIPVAEETTEDEEDLPPPQEPRP